MADYATNKFSAKIYHLWSSLFSIYGMNVWVITRPKSRLLQIGKIPFVLILVWCLQVSLFVYFASLFSFAMLDGVSVEKGTENVVEIAPKCVIILLSFVSTITLFLKRHFLRNLIVELALVTQKHGKRLWREMVVSLSIGFIINIFSVISDVLGPLFYGEELHEQYCFYLLQSESCYDIPKILNGTLNDKEYISATKLHRLLYKYYTILKVVLCCLLFYCAYTLTQVCVVLFSQLCKAVALSIIDINHELKNLAAKNYYSAVDLNECRLRYEAICNWVNDISFIFSPALLFWVFFVVFEFCFDVRGISTMYSEEFFKIGNFVNNVFLFVVLYKNASQLHKESQLTVQYFTNLFPKYDSENTVDREENADVQTRFNITTQYGLHLISKKVGINVSDLFIIDGRFILTVIATVATYSVLLLQSTK